MKRGNMALRFRVLLIWLGIILVGTLWMSARASTDPVAIMVMPENPRKGEPVLATFKLSNSSGREVSGNYELYANGILLKSGTTLLPAHSTKVYQHLYSHELRLGDRVNFFAAFRTDQGAFEKTVSAPPYPPQVWSSFVSFASFSTSVMGSMSSMVYYQDTFTTNVGLQVGMVFAIVLLLLLIFREVTVTVPRPVEVGNLGLLRVKFRFLAAILLIIFVGMIFTRVGLVLGG